MRMFRLGLLLGILAAAVAFGEDTNTSITINGVTYENFHWGTLTPTTVSIFHKTGVTTIPLEKLSPDLQARFGYDPKKIAQSTAAQKAPPPGSSSTSGAGNRGLKHPVELAGIGSLNPISFPVLIVFVNRSRETRRIYWLDFKGGRELYGEVKPKATFEQQTYVGHPWLVTDTLENALGVYYPDGQKRVVVVE